MTIVLQNIEVDWRDRKVIWNLYNKQVAYVRIEDGLSTACTIGRGDFSTVCGRDVDVDAERQKIRSL